ncbi:MAG TPA: nicotinate phosphoribosyltransferase [Chthoniobacteraceae bacterium]|nr:nicotinate phosphoribosyltransferase [Chthoniobacteraceae bacterium]
MSSALLTDLYQLTMAAAFWKSGTAAKEAAFQLIFRRQPFGSGFTIACGLADAIAWLEALRFTAEDLAYLTTLRGADEQPLFERAFLDFLGSLTWSCDVDAIPEGTVVFPHEPLVRVQGPILECQLAETALLTIINFQTLIATKSARVCLAARGDPVIEFGLRRAQGPDGGLSASRAAFVGGCAGTSNTLAGQRFGIPVRGTHAHSWVMSFETEDDAFRAYAEAMPHNSIFLVDTYNTLDGVRRAIAAGKWLRERGHTLAGIRLDSGDLAWLSRKSRELLDAAGFENAVILASNDLDETVIASLKEQGAAIGAWGVGTRLVTAFDEPALGGIYKLTAVREPGGDWKPRLKLSEQTAKISLPGIHQVRRFSAGGQFIGDAIYDLLDEPADEWTIVNPDDSARRKNFPGDTAGEDLLVPIFRGGRRVYELPPLTAIRERTQQQLAALDPTIKRLLNPHEYPAGIETRLFERRQRLIEDLRSQISDFRSGAPPLQSEI